MLKVHGTDLANLGASYANGTTFDVEWVPIASPDNPARNARELRLGAGASARGRDVREARRLLVRQ